jgi:hypothetical protein
MCGTGGTVTVKENVLRQLLQRRCVITRYVLGQGLLRFILWGYVRRPYMSAGAMLRAPCMKVTVGSDES